jgi:hypothetical protein
MKLRADLVEKLNVDDGPVDVSRWFQRYELFVDCSEGKMESEFDRSGLYLRYLPLFLTGTALMCFEEMPDEDKIAYILIKHQLCEYFALDATSAYSKFADSKFTPGVGVDGFIALLRRYTNIMKIEKHSADQLILEQFMRAIPTSAATELRVRCGHGDQLELHSVLRVARH